MVNVQANTFAPEVLSRLHSGGDLLLAVVLLVLGGAGWYLSSRRGLPMEKTWRVMARALSALLVVGGTNELVLAILELHEGAYEPLFDYITVLVGCVALMVFLPWFLWRAVRARRAISSLRKEVASVGQIAHEAQARQRDLTRQFAESTSRLEETTEEAQRFAELVSSSKDAVIGVNDDGTVWHWNPAAEQLLRYPASRLLGKSLESVRVAHNGDLWREVQRIDARPFQGRQSEMSLVTGDGRVVPVWLSVSRLPKHGAKDGGLAIIARDMSEKKAIEERVSLALIEKETLLKEIHHRVKNNLQLICSLLRLQSKEAPDTEALKFFRKSEERIRSLALVHEKLYRSESLSTIAFGSYVRDLVSQLVRASGEEARSIEVEFDVEELDFPIDSAITCGLILNELVTNSTKHGIPTDGVLRLLVTLKRMEDCIRLSVWNNGGARFDSARLARPSSLGLNLVTTLSRQLGGSVTVSEDGGVAFVVTLPNSVLQCKELPLPKAVA